MSVESCIIFSLSIEIDEGSKQQKINSKQKKVSKNDIYPIFSCTSQYGFG